MSKSKYKKRQEKNNSLPLGISTTSVPPAPIKQAAVSRPPVVSHTPVPVNKKPMTILEMLKASSKKTHSPYKYLTMKQNVERRDIYSFTSFFVKNNLREIFDKNTLPRYHANFAKLEIFYLRLQLFDKICQLFSKYALNVDALSKASDIIYELHNSIINNLTTIKEKQSFSYLSKDYLNKCEICLDLLKQVKTALAVTQPVSDDLANKVLFYNDFILKLIDNLERKDGILDLLIYSKSHFIPDFQQMFFHLVSFLDFLNGENVETFVVAPVIPDGIVPNTPSTKSKVKQPLLSVPPILPPTQYLYPTSPFAVQSYSGLSYSDVLRHAICQSIKRIELNSKTFQDSYTYLYILLGYIEVSPVCHPYFLKMPPPTSIKTEVPDSTMQLHQYLQEHVSLFRFYIYSSFKTYKVLDHNIFINLPYGQIIKSSFTELFHKPLSINATSNIIKYLNRVTHYLFEFLNQNISSEILENLVNNYLDIIPVSKIPVNDPIPIPSPVEIDSSSVTVSSVVEINVTPQSLAAVTPVDPVTANPASVNDSTATVVDIELTSQSSVQHDPSTSLEIQDLPSSPILVNPVSLDSSLDEGNKKSE